MGSRRRRSSVEQPSSSNDHADNHAKSGPSSSSSSSSSSTSSHNVKGERRESKGQSSAATSSPPAYTQKRQMNVDTDFPPSGTLAKVQKNFNAKVAMNDPLPDILSEMAMAPVASKIVSRRSERLTHDSASSATDVTALRRSPRKCVITSTLDEMYKEEPNEKHKERSDEGAASNDDELTQDQETIWHENSKRMLTIERCVLIPQCNFALFDFC